MITIKNIKLLIVMPTKPLKNCSQPGCGNLVESGRCEKHRKRNHQRYDETRGNSGDRGYDALWQKVRLMKLSMNPLCQMCEDEGRIVAAKLVHHIKPVENHPELRLYADNLMSLCVMHHEVIHARIKKYA